MGCHTWFYKKIEKPSFDEMKEIVLTTYKTTINNLDRWINNPLDEEYLEMLSVYSDWTMDIIIKWRDAELRRVRMIENGYCKQAVVNKYCSFHEDILVPVGDNIYCDVDGYHDLFRKYGYPDTELFSLQETLNYIDDVNNECVVYDFTKDKLVEFWTKYPDGMIDFG